MVGAPPTLYERIKPILDYMASDVPLGGDVGAGQVPNLVNNMLVFANTVALAEMIVLGERAGVKAETLLEAVSKGSGDSFVLRNHGMKAMIPDTFPKQAFPTDYALKDVSYALELARDAGLSAPGAELAEARMRMAKAAGFAEEYFPVLARLAGRPTG